MKSCEPIKTDRGYAITPLIMTLDVNLLSRYRELGVQYESSCVSLPCRGCQSCQARQNPSKNLLEEISKKEIEALFLKILSKPSYQ